MFDSDFSSGLDSGWRVESNGSTYGSTNNSIGVWSTSHVDASGGTLKLKSSFDGTTYRGGMIQTRVGSSAPFSGKLFPRYAYYEARMRVPNGKALWPAFWLRHKYGSSTCEVDVMEMFNGDTAGHARFTLHRKAASGAATTSNLGKKNIKLQDPFMPDGVTRKVPDWHTVGVNIYPLGRTADVPANSVVFDYWIDGVKVWTYTDTSALYWTGLAQDDAFDICLQGSQIGGTWVGHPDDPKGYSRYLNGGAGGCISGGTPPNSCTASFGGVPVVDTDWSAEQSTFELDYVRVWAYDPAALPPPIAG